MSSKRASVIATALLIAGALTACGGSDVETRTETVTASPNTSPGGHSQRQEAKEVVRAYYRRVNAGAFRQAWNLLATPVQEQLRSFASWRDGYRFTERTTVTSLDTLSQGPGRYEFAIGLRAVANDACGDRIHQVYSASWVVERVEGDLVGTDLAARQTGGGESIEDPAECPPTEAPPAPTAPAEPEPAECDPNYEGACLDPSASDYDCEGGTGDGPLYTGEVIVVGEDHFGLDGDGNGLGCESG